MRALLALALLVAVIVPTARAGVRSGSSYRLPGGATATIFVRGTMMGEANPRAVIKDASGNITERAPEQTGTPTLGGCANECQASEDMDPEPVDGGAAGAAPDLRVKNGKLQRETAQGNWTNCPPVKSPTCGDEEEGPHPTPTPQGGDDEEDNGDDSVGSIPVRVKKAAALL